LKIDRSSGANVLTVPENWKDTWRVSAGANYHYNEQWLARVGVAFDQSPVPNAYRTARIPDSDRTWLSFGGQYKPSKAGRLDFAYAYLAVKAATIADDQAAGDLALIAGQKAVITMSRKSIATYKLRDGQAIGCKVTLRKTRMYDFIDRLVNIALLLIPLHLLGVVSGSLQHKENLVRAMVTGMKAKATEVQ